MGTKDHWESSRRQDQGTPSAGLSPIHGQLYYSLAFSPQALQHKMAMDQVGVGQGSGEVWGWGLGPSPATYLSTRLWSGCETPEAR